MLYEYRREEPLHELIQTTRGTFTHLDAETFPRWVTINPLLPIHNIANDDYELRMDLVHEDGTVVAADLAIWRMEGNGTLADINIRNSVPVFLPPRHRLQFTLRLENSVNFEVTTHRCRHIPLGSAGPYSRNRFGGYERVEDPVGTFTTQRPMLLYLTYDITGATDNAFGKTCQASNPPSASQVRPGVQDWLDALNFDHLGFTVIAPIPANTEVFVSVTFDQQMGDPTDYWNYFLHL